MLHSYSPKYNDKPNTNKWVDNTREFLQTENPFFVSLLQGVSFIKHLQRLLLLSLINIDKFVPPEKTPNYIRNITIKHWNLSIKEASLTSLLMGFLSLKQEQQKGLHPDFQQSLHSHRCRQYEGLRGD